MGTLRAAHGAAQSAPKDDGKKKYMRYGLDLLNGQIRDNVTAGVLEPTMSKVKSLKSAFEAAVSLLRIDDAIACAPGEYCFWAISIFLQFSSIFNIFYFLKLPRVGLGY